MFLSSKFCFCLLVQISVEGEDSEQSIISGLSCMVIGLCALFNEGGAGEGQGGGATLNRGMLRKLVHDRIGAHVFKNRLAGTVVDNVKDN